MKQIRNAQISNTNQNTEPNGNRQSIPTIFITYLNSGKKIIITYSNSTNEISIQRYYFCRFLQR